MTMAQSSVRLTGRRLILLRVIWASSAVFFAVISVAALPQDVRTAGRDARAWLEILLEVYFLALGLFIFWRRSDEWLACVLSLTFLMALSTDNLQALFGTGPVAQRLDLVLAAISSTVLLCLFYVFPDGHFVPRWTRWAAAAQVTIQAWRVFFEEAYMERGLALIGLLFLTALAAQIYRYLRVSDAVQRQQIKWLVFGLAITVPPVALALVLFSFTSTKIVEMRALGEQLGFVFWMAFLVVLPLSITISILRYRLWDIDIIIRKTLVYSALTVLLALVFFGAVIALQMLVRSLTGEQSPVVIVISTLIIAALFTPLRRRVQDVIDRRFYRRRYDAEKTLANFGQFVRDETDLEALTAELLRVTEETMQPEVVVVWLKNTKRSVGDM